MKDKLNEKELAIFNCIGEGLHAREIAKKLNLKPQTISTYRHRILMKLGLKSTTEVVKMWIWEEAQKYLWLDEKYGKMNLGENWLRHILSIKD